MDTVYDLHKLTTGSPRERIAAEGPARISDEELLAALLGSGSRAHRVDALARSVLALFDKNDSHPKYKELTGIPGLGSAKAAQIIASWEFCRRRMKPAENVIRTPEELIPLIRHFGTRQQEYFLSIPLNGAHEVIGIYVVSIGLVNRTLVHPREVFRPALEHSAAALLCAHNHPSGRLLPSEEDSEITLRLIQAGTLLGIPMLDHIIFHGTRFYSFLGEGKLEESNMNPGT